MASHGLRDDQGPVVPDNTSPPSFFAVVITKALLDGKLEIPEAVVRQYGDRLGETITVKVPTGAVWDLGLAKSKGKIWLQKLWPEFAEFYSLKHGDILLFISEGDFSQFGVQIYKRNSLEMNYPTNSSDGEDEDEYDTEE